MDQAVKELIPQGEARGTVVNVGNDAALTGWIAATVDAFGGLDIVVSNASAQSLEWRTSVDVDILSAVRLMDLVEPHLRRSSSGAVVASLRGRAAWQSRPTSPTRRLKPHS